MDGYGSKQYIYGGEGGIHNGAVAGGGGGSAAAGGMQLDLYRPPGPPQNQPQMHEYSRSYSYSQSQSNNQFRPNEFDYKLKKIKTAPSSTSKVWCFSDPEYQRKKRVVSYRAYSVEGKVKGSLKKSIRWVQNRYRRIIYGW